MCYLGKVNSFDRDDQLALCYKMIDKLELTPIDELCKVAIATIQRIFNTRQKCAEWLDSLK